MNNIDIPLLTQNSTFFLNPSLRISFICDCFCFSLSIIDSIFSLSSSSGSLFSSSFTTIFVVTGGGVVSTTSPSAVTTVSGTIHDYNKHHKNMDHKLYFHNHHNNIFVHNCHDNNVNWDVYYDDVMSLLYVDYDVFLYVLMENLNQNLNENLNEISYDTL